MMYYTEGNCTSIYSTCIIVRVTHDLINDEPKKWICRLKW